MSISNLIKGLVVIIFLLMQITVQAKQVMIIHTNDLHSYFKGPKYSDEGILGGYARVKSVIDELKRKAKAMKIPSIVIDGGDFGEGASFFYVNDGIESFKALDLLGVDAAVVGNHDFMLGGMKLGDQIRQSGLKAKLLSANIKFKEPIVQEELVHPQYSFNMDGKKITIIGLTTAEPHYQYPLLFEGSRVAAAVPAGLAQEIFARYGVVIDPSEFGDYTDELLHLEGVKKMYSKNAKKDWAINATMEIDKQKNDIKMKIPNYSDDELERRSPEGFQKPDLVIALTHLGVSIDKILTNLSSQIDVVVGGHSHTTLEQVEWTSNRKGRKIPIVQTGAHGLRVGELILNLKGQRDVEVVDYRLHRVDNNVNEDEKVKNFVTRAVMMRDQQFGGTFDEVIGYSEIPMSGYKNGKPNIEKTCWGEHMAKMNKEEMNADVGVHVAFFEGERSDPGPLTYGNIVDNFPHFRDYGDQGWRFSTFKGTGRFLKVLSSALRNLKKSYGLFLYGMNYKTFKLPEWLSWMPYIGEKTFLYAHEINGQELIDDQWYTVSFPAEIGQAIKGLVGENIRKIFPEFQESENKFYWTSMKEYIQKNSPLRCL
jgi:2',3'-cyclic-nucleotide 2'-phosphodiesterase (5'-nucleotidase family)